MFKRTLLLFVSIFFFLQIKAQTIPNYINAKTPEVTAFNRFIETPVSLYSGIPSISIPLYEISIHGVSVPITLNYHAGGIRADQEATWVGLGWSLDYGGAISRKVRGNPDEDFLIPGAGTGNDIDHFNQLPLTTDNFPNDIYNRMDYIRNAKYGGNDYLPDEYYYSTLGYSGKFMFNQEQKKFVLFPKEDLAVSYFSNGASLLYCWNIKLPNGTSVDFGKEGITSQTVTPKTTKSAWQIKAIRNIYNDSITYDYDNFSYTTYPLSNVKASFYSLLTGSGYAGSPTSNLYPTSSFSQVIVNDTRVRTITFPTGTISFITKNRNDMATQALSEIDVKDLQGNMIKKITFNTSYFNGNAFDMLPTESSTLANNYVPANYRFLRLKLDGITIQGADQQTKNYMFDYYTGSSMPSKYTFAQDHWGFYNGMANTTAASFIPNIASGFFQGGDRSVKPNYSSVFSLKSVTYPEGGKTLFQYENNTAQVAYAPRELLSMYQDDNIPEVNQGIGASSYSRRNYEHVPDSTDNNGSVYYINRFTVSPTGYFATNIGFSVSTDYGISTIEQYTPYNADNVEFDVNQISSYGTRTLIKSFNTTNQNQNPDGTYTRNGTLNAGMNLQPGHYEMIVKITYLNAIGSAAENQHYNLYFNVRYRELDIAKMMINVGGLRIKKISYLNNDNTLKKSKLFTYVNPNNSNIPTLTSGRIVSLPNYFQRTCQVPWRDNGASGVIAAINFLSNSSLPLETTSGSFAGYEYVDELDVDSLTGNNLKTTYNFSYNQPYFYSSNYPYISSRAYEPQEWTNGKLISKKYFRGQSPIMQENYQYYSTSPHLTSNNQEDFVQEINTDLISLEYIATSQRSTYPFDFYDMNAASISDIYVPQAFGQITCAGFIYGAGNSSFSPSIQGAGDVLTFCQGMNISVPYFTHYTGFDKLQQKVTTTYDGGTPVVKTENYFYEKTPALHQLTRTQTINSKQDILEQKILYPIDSASTDVYNQMLMRHIVDPPIVQSTYKNSVFLQSANTNYAQWTNGDIIAPLRNSLKIGPAAPFAKVVYSAYDNKGNILSALRPGGAAVSVQWGYNQTYPVAQVVNAKSNDIFFENFEDGNGNSPINNAKSGHYSYSGNFSKTINNLDNGAYTLSYWQGSGLNWSFQTSTVSVAGGTYSIAINSGSYIDDIRFFPASAQATTYTYDSMVGITSITDPRNQSIYYEYDGLQRLVSIRDQDRNIIKTIAYNYANHAVPPSQTVPLLSLANITYNAVSINYTTTSDPGTGCLLKYTDLSTSTTYQTTINCNSTQSTTVLVPVQGRTYRFVAVENLSAGGQINSAPLDIYVP